MRSKSILQFNSLQIFLNNKSIFIGFRRIDATRNSASCFSISTLRSFSVIITGILTVDLYSFFSFNSVKISILSKSQEDIIKSGFSFFIFNEPSKPSLQQTTSIPALFSLSFKYCLSISSLSIRTILFFIISPIKNNHLFYFYIIAFKLQNAA